MGEKKVYNESLLSSPHICISRNVKHLTTENKKTMINTINSLPLFSPPNQDLIYEATSKKSHRYFLPYMKINLYMNIIIELEGLKWLIQSLFKCIVCPIKLKKSNNRKPKKHDSLLLFYSQSHKVEISECFKSHRLEFKGQSSNLKHVEKIDE